MDGSLLDSVETWQCQGDTFETFQQVICSFFTWNCNVEDDSTDCGWQMNLGVLKSQAGRHAPRILMARLTTDRNFVQIQSEPVDDVVIIMPVRGTLHLERGGEGRTIAAGSAIIYQPQTAARIRHLTDDQTSECYIIKLSFEWVQRFLFESLRLPVENDLQLGPEIDLKAPEARMLARLISTFCSDTFTFQSRHLSATLQQRMAETFSQLLLESIPHRYSERLRPSQSGPVPNYLRLARDFMHREARRNPSMPEVAKAANISVRTLEISFRTYLDVTPHVYLRTVRLQMAHQTLKDGADLRPIAEIAADHGFPHAGRFSHYYANLFGESPSDTRRKGPVTS